MEQLGRGSASIVHVWLLIVMVAGQSESSNITIGVSFTSKTLRSWYDGLIIVTLSSCLLK